eukprot:366356-Chlamydomonas_euryale.AAC.5
MRPPFIQEDERTGRLGDGDASAARIKELEARVAELEAALAALQGDKDGLGKELDEAKVLTAQGRRAGRAAGAGVFLAGPAGAGCWARASVF